jgi:4-hydroxybenzoate polyprenyltransferase
MASVPNSSVAAASDIPRGAWVDRVLPVGARPYARLARLDRPIGTWLLLFPCWWGIALAAQAWPDPYLIVVFALGALLLRGAGCTYNDIVDRDFDARVARTADRPIPSGAVSVRQAVVFLVLQLLLGLVILLTFNITAIWLGVLSLVLVFTYPLMKRVTWWPQFFLGLAFNWGALMGYAAADGSPALPSLLLYLAGIFWTLGYDTIYAHQDKEDDALIGVKSTARLFAENTQPALYGFYGATVLVLSAVGVAAHLGWPYFVLLAAGAAQLVWQAARVDTESPTDCLAKFKSNRLFGWLVLAGIIAGKLVPAA